MTGEIMSCLLPWRSYLCFLANVLMELPVSDDLSTCLFIDIKRSFPIHACRYLFVFSEKEWRHPLLFYWNPCTIETNCHESQYNSSILKWFTAYSSPEGKICFSVSKHQCMHIHEMWMYKWEHPWMELLENEVCIRCAIHVQLVESACKNWWNRLWIKMALHYGKCYSEYILNMWSNKLEDLP